MEVLFYVEHRYLQMHTPWLYILQTVQSTQREHFPFGAIGSTILQPEHYNVSGVVR